MLQNSLNSSKLMPPEQSSSRWAKISKARCRACFRSSVGYLLMYWRRAFTEFSFAAHFPRWFVVSHKYTRSGTSRQRASVTPPARVQVHTHAAHRSSTNSRISFSSKTDLFGSQVAPLRLHRRNATSTAFARSNTRYRGNELKKVRKSTHPVRTKARGRELSTRHGVQFVRTVLQISVRLRGSVSTNLLEGNNETNDGPLPTYRDGTRGLETCLQSFYQAG